MLNTITTKKSLIFLPLIVTTVAGVYPSWQLVGLRYTNHDDIYLNLYSWIFSGNPLNFVIHDDYLSFIGNVAYSLTRLHIYVGLPISLWVDKLTDSVLFDILNTGTFGALYISLIWLLIKIWSVRDVLAALNERVGEYQQWLIHLLPLNH